MQLLLVIIILAICVAYTVYRVWRRFTMPPSRFPQCDGCPLAGSCTHSPQQEHSATASGGSQHSCPHCGQNPASNCCC